MAGSLYAGAQLCSDTSAYLDEKDNNFYELLFSS